MQMICLIILLLVAKALGQSQTDVGALLEVKKGIQKDPSGKVFDSWNSNSLASDGCPQNWFGITCNDGHVTSIVLDNVGLIGEFNFSALSSLTNLQNLSVSNNQLNGNISILGSGLDQLKHLDLHSNAFSGDITGLLSLLGSIEYVDLSSNQLSGTLDFDLGNSSFVSTIQFWNISYNELTGQLFVHDGMPYFDSLEVFDASNNQLEGKIPSFNFVVSLKILRLGNNRLSGSLPQALLQESSMVLSELDLSSNLLEGPLGSITSATLKKLNLSSNKLSGSLPTTVGHCTVIDLSNNILSGNLSRIQNWGNYVEVIELSSNSLTGTLPSETSQFLRLRAFKVSRNLLVGSLPQVLGTYPELLEIDLSLNKLSGSLLPSLFNSTTLTDLNLSGNNFSGSIPLGDASDISSIGSTQNMSLTSLDLSSNSLSGHLPHEIGMFHALVYLNLSRNNFDGGIPDSMPNGLKGFDVSYNNFSGIVPDNLRRFPESSFHPGNPWLVFPHASSPKGAPWISRNHRPHMKTAIKVALIAGSIGAVGMIILMFLIIYYGKCRQEQRNSLTGGTAKKGYPQGDFSSSYTSSPSKLAPLDHPPSSQMQPVLESSTAPSTSAIEKSKDIDRPESFRKDEGMSSPLSLLSSSNTSPSKQPNPDSPGVLNVCSPDKLDGDLHLFEGSFQFTAGELSRALAEVLGRSCHGTLYKAKLDSGHILAVKWLREGIVKGRKDFSREAKKLGSIKHPNLVSLQGYYWGPKEHEKLIISDYVNAASLDLYLHEQEPRKLPVLPLDVRLRISVDVARCLNFLHNEPAIPHGNLKSANILVETSTMNALLTDYSLHRIMTTAGTTEQVLNSGALGYRPPEFASSSKPMPSLKSDVYAFGVVLLELLTGKSSGEIVSGDPGVVDLIDWVRLLAAKRRSDECYDRHIVPTDNAEQTSRILDEILYVALRCVYPASERPDIRTVFEELSAIVL